MDQRRSLSWLSHCKREKVSAAFGDKHGDDGGGGDRWGGVMDGSVHACNLGRHGSEVSWKGTAVMGRRCWGEEAPVGGLRDGKAATWE